MKRRFLTALSLSIMLLCMTPLISLAEDVPLKEDVTLKEDAPLKKDITFKEDVAMADSDTRSAIKKISYGFGAEMSYITYKEPDVMKQQGGMIGIVGHYTYHNKIMLEAEGRVSYGKVDYNGYLFNINTGNKTPYTVDDITDYIFEFRGLLGYDFNIDKSTTMTFFTGIGYRYLNDNFQEKSIYGYERESNYYYSPIGVEFTANVSNNWSVVGRAEYDYFWKGEQKSHLSDLSPSYPDISNSQNSGYGLRAALTLEKGTFQVGAFIRYWNIAESEIELGIIEPENNSTEIGILLGVRY